MAASDVLSDTEFAAAAAEAVDGFVKEHGCPVKRAQISGLRQVAENQPTRIPEFAEHQKQRAEKRGAGAEAEFWRLVRRLCDGKGARSPWSLEQVADRCLPDELQLEATAAGAKLTQEEQARRAAVKKTRQQWLTAWRVEHYPAFFQRFCAHYLYCLGKSSP